MANSERAKREVRSILARLKTALRARGISLQDASVNAGLAPQYVSRVTRADSNVILENIVQVCLANEIELFEVMLDEGQADQLRALKTFSAGLPLNEEAKRRDLAQSMLSDWRVRVKLEQDK